VSVIATIREINSDTINAIPSGCNILPSIPLKKKSGMNATIIMSVAFNIDALISTYALKTTR
jgi:hypothetical protein